MEAGEGRSFEWSREEGLAVVTLDAAGNDLNYIGLPALDELERVVDEIEQDDGVGAVVLRSVKPDVFCAGADISLFEEITSAKQGTEVSQRLQTIVQRVAGSRKEWLAAIDGLAFGGGLEIALACDYRLATDSPSTVLAFPEVDLGLIPGGGGTQMLPRLVGLRHALDMILTARRLSARKARQWQLVDELARPEKFDDAVRRAADKLCSGWHPDRETSGFERFQLLPGMRDVILARARHKLRVRTRGNYPAQDAAFECIRTGLEKGQQKGLENESRRFGRLVVSRESRNLSWLFLASSALRHYETPRARPVEHVGILGAGFHSAVLADSSLSRARVTIADRSSEKLAVVRGRVDGLLQERKLEGAITELEIERLRSRLRFTDDMDELSECDVVVEDVAEDVETKRAVIRALLHENAVIASDSAAIPLSKIVEGQPLASRVIGAHFFAPLGNQSLIEIVRSEETNPEVEDTVVRLGISQNRSVIFATDTPGFYVNRLGMSLINEAMLMVEERYDPRDIDEALLDFGFVHGPLFMADELGIDNVVSILATLAPRFARRGATAAKLPRRMVKDGLHGRSSGAGFYVYGRRKPLRKAPVNRRIGELLRISNFRRRPGSEHGERMVLSQINEVAWCIREGVVQTPVEADVGAVLGVGFPPFRGGPLKHVDTFGAGAFVRKLERLERELGERFRPCPLLVEMAERNETFYGSR